MCRPISMILSESEHWLPDIDEWSHSYSQISMANGLEDGLRIDKYVRVQVYPPMGQFRDSNANLIEFSDDWKVNLNKLSEPDWWSEDPEKHTDRARKYAERWWEEFRDRGAVHLAPGYRAIGGDGAALIGGDESTLTGGDWSTLTGGNRSTLTGGNRSTLTGKYGSTLTGGYGSTLTGGDRSTLTGGDGSTLIFRYCDENRQRIAVAYVGEDGIEPGVPYKCEGGRIVKAKKESDR